MLFERKNKGCEEDTLTLRDKGYTNEYYELVKEYLWITNYKLRITNHPFCFLLSAFCFLLTSCAHKLHTGDLIFVSSKSSDFEKSIAEVTKTDEDTLNFTHTGMINVTDSGVFVIEAVPEKGVIYSSFQEFKTENKNSILYVGALPSEYKKYTAAAIDRACSHIGKGYDYAFDLENDLYYCSELVYDAYAHASGNPRFFETPNMTFKKENSDDFLPYWMTYFEKQNIPIPEGKPGINPNGLSRSDKLSITN
jgi:hypothetical protein